MPSAMIQRVAEIGSLCDRLSGTFGAVDEFIRQPHRLSGVQNDADCGHITDVAVRCAWRNEQKIAGLEHVFALICARGAPAGELKGNFVLAKTTMIDSLRIRAVG